MDKKLSYPCFRELRILPTYNIDLQQLQEDFGRAAGSIYLDHAASTLYSEKQLNLIFTSFKNSLYGNPHSRHNPSYSTTEAIESIRHLVLKFFNTNDQEYDVVFTSSATDAIKLVGQHFSWTCGKEGDGESLGQIVYTQENHTSVLGLRELAHIEGAKVYCLPADNVENVLQRVPFDTNPSDPSSSYEVNSLFVFPAQCNFSGSKYPLKWIERVQKGGIALEDIPTINKNQLKQTATSSKTPKHEKWFVLLDAASLVATSPLNLNKYKPDFVPVSFYKIFGYPTGLGCLLVNKRAWKYLNKPYFGGGTVKMADSRTMEVKRRDCLHERFEDGTLPFLDIISLEHGINYLLNISGGMANIERHVYNLSRYLAYNLRSLKHSNNSPVVQIYSQSSHWTINNHGSIVNFNVKDSNGKFVGYSQVERVASLYNIYLRTGCVCNPGACQKYLDISPEQLKRQFEAGHVCGDANDLVDGMPTGSVRVSFGYMSTYEDADKVLKMIGECFVEGEAVLDTSWLTEINNIPSKETSINNNQWNAHLNDSTSSTPESDVINVNDQSNDQRYNYQQYVRPNIKITASTNSVSHEKEPNNTETCITSVTDKVGSCEYDIQQNKYQSNVNFKDNISSPKYCTPDNQSGVVQNDKNHQDKQNHNKIFTKIDKPLSINSNEHSKTSLRLTNIIIYPIKSCAGISLSNWKIGPRGLEYDRQWMIVTSSGVTLTQKRAPKLSLLKPSIQEDLNTLTITREGFGSVNISLEPAESSNDTDSNALVCGGRVCGDRIRGSDCGNQVSQWLSTAMETEGLRLVRQMQARKSKLSPEEPEPTLSLANESQYLVIHAPSLLLLQNQMETRSSVTISLEELILRFRPNLVLDGGDPYDEDNWKSFKIEDKESFQVLGKCSRCQMVCVNPQTGERSKEPMITLGVTRGPSMAFGVHASCSNKTSPDSSNTDDRILHVGMCVNVYR